MGRYDGEEYEKVAPCMPPSKHQFMPNGHCHVCRCSREELISGAKATLRELTDIKIE